MAPPLFGSVTPFLWSLCKALPVQPSATARPFAVAARGLVVFDEPGPGEQPGRDQDASLLAAGQAVFVALAASFPVHERDVRSRLLR